MIRFAPGAVKRNGACAKDKSPFSEFRWADFLRTRIDREIVGGDFDRALSLAIELALSRAAKKLPGMARD